ncbi:hypothetical protein QE152_g26645 [Popillia japonica]|uniref:Uncharacterized protein n=1 Tax=Popillia japonica TaxID=7064 RepID=A0AAW1JY30_POPJA
MKVIIFLSFFLIVATAETLEPTTRQLEKETPLSSLEETLNNSSGGTLDTQPQSQLTSAPVELQDKKTRPQRHLLIKTEIPTLVVPTYEIPQFYVVVDQPHYAPWYYHPALPIKETPEQKQ